MKQVFCVSFSDAPADGLQLREVEAPQPGSDEVLIEMLACPINPADLLLLTGRHYYKPALPAAVGIEGVGRVIETGAGVESPAVGEVVAVPFGGTWRERMTMKARDVLRVPSDVDVMQVAMLSVNPVTASGLLEGVAPGEWVVQNAANSAVGQLVIRLAAHRGIRTVNIVRRAELVPELEALGADVVLVGDEGLAERVKEATGSAPVLRALDAVAGEATGKLHRCLSEGGRLICYGLLNSNEIVLGAADVVFRDIVVTGYSRLRLLRQMQPERVAELMAELSDLLRLGILQSPIEKVYPLDAVHQAVEHADQPGRSGKILLRIGQP
ncbi:MAG: zinc-dependent alcohol dehydrogenase family protein [bacterium]|nr:zinc-dependent alcohol dehydrogenase family protein [bacterium]